MCGITGVFAFTDAGKLAVAQLQRASAALQHRGPDAEGVYLHGPVGLAHRRLSIIGPAAEANQPFSDSSGRYTIVYNGEIFNYTSLRSKLQSKGHAFCTESDTEVILHLYKQEGQECLKKLQGFFVFAIYDADEESLFIARDRFGEKPLLYYRDADRLLFASEMGALLELGVPRELDYASLYQYLQLTYVPAPASMLKGVRKLLPGHSLYIRGEKPKEMLWYRLSFDADKASQNPLTYKQQQVKLKQLLDQAVEGRLIADVPVGAFLSGGIDSSVVVALASQKVQQLKTYSVSFPEQPYFDESKYALLVAKKFNTDHTEVRLTQRGMEDQLEGFLNSISEPFADSSALAVYMLSQYVSQDVKAVLSGDGADELFAGYNKHQAEYRLMQGGIAADLIAKLGPLWDILPKSRNSYTTNKVRQLQRFSTGAKLPAKERYWLWATWQREKEALALLRAEHQTVAESRLYRYRKKYLLEYINNQNQYNLNNVLIADWHLVLANDMLPKIDMMGMAHGVEVRSPFLDHRLVKFAFSLPVSSKIALDIQKRILQDTFRNVLPSELYNRPKKGFEIPLLHLLQTAGETGLFEEYLSDKFIKEQGIFKVNEIKAVREALKAGKEASVQSKMWSLLVFQYWWVKHLKS
ncbi:asparagine synthase (glutamine-hydrolyzing) [Pontibacter silvestris]|uniref:asparagine synthase (glutamine-hydrolyzing) n=1 Tax=Pontibacter silvestris TaxID=2305183 RepID=A0ABW4WUM2_9BACT|nr:asparagine synthase (glutamine-hydrolyzing) [Pontibacter silvestris]MCC9138104.1 asparagine synthase (glutamine-hydrolyzing) [Pontibacter silvestris]